MAGRVKFEVWNDRWKYWADAQVKRELSMENALRFIRFGFTVRVDGITMTPPVQAKAA